MLPYININFSLSPIHLHTYSTMLWAYLSIAGFILFVRWNKSLGLRETCSFLFGIVFFGLLGARLMHCLWEAPQYYLEHPERILTSFNGMTFYGSFFLALPYTLYFIRRWRAKFSENEVSKTVSDFLIVLSLGYAILRIGCFLNGCCWGRITGLPWAVVYTHSDSAMPMLGIPVHPVQLYESALAFVLSGILISLRFFSNQIDYYSGLAIFFILHPISRFATEYFRADDFRGVYRFGLSTSQVLSILLFLGGIMFLFSKRKNHEKKLSYA